MSVTNFVALGQRLREAREAKEMSPDDVERATRIRARFIEQMERGEYGGMTPVQAQGFLRNYARFLGIDLDLLESELNGDEPKSRLGRVRREPPHTPQTATQTIEMTPRPGQRAESTPRRPRRGWLTNTGIVLIAGAIVVLFVLGATALLNSFSESAEGEGATTVDLSPGPEGDGDSVQESGNPADGGEEAGESGDDMPGADGQAPQTPELAYTPPGDTGSNVVVSVNLTQRTWLRVTVDGEVTRQGLARPGEVWQFEGEESVGLRASNAAALDLSVNNQRQGTLGGRGQLFDQTFTREGLAAPPTPEPSITGPAPDTLSSNPAPAPATVTASPEQATLVLSPTLDPDAPLASGAEDGLAIQLASATPEPATIEPATREPSPEPPSPEPPSAEPPTAEPPSAEPPTREPDTATPRPTPTTAPTAFPSATNTPAWTRTPRPTGTPTSTRTPSASPSSSPSPTASMTRTPMPLPSWTPTWTITPTATATPSATPFLPPRVTRTPTVSPK